MQEFLRRNFWVVHLASIAVGAWLLAAIATQAAAWQILKPDPNAAQAALAAIPTPVPKPVKAESQVSLVSTLGDHNVFDAEPPVVVETTDGEEGEGTPVPSLDFAVDLLGTLVATDPQWSLATVRVDGITQMVKMGVMLREQAEVVEIAPRYIVLAAGTDFKVVKLWDAKTADRPASPRAGMPTASVGMAPPSAGPKDDFAKGVHKKGPYDYQIDRSMLEENLQDLTKLGMQARIVPNYEAGKYSGFRLVGVRPDSLYKAIGLQSGDMISRVNGQNIDTPNRAIQLFEELRSSSGINLDIERRGKKITLNYQIK